MKTYFSFSLRGKDWWKPFIGFWLIMLVCYIIPVTTMTRWAPGLTERTGLYFLVLGGLVLLLMIVQTIFAIVLLRIVLPKVEVGGDHFAFKGDIGTYLGITVLNYLLTLITLGIFFPWFVRRVTAYLMREASFRDASFEFLGRGGKLFVYFLLSFLLPVIIVSVVIGLIVGFQSMGASGEGVTPLTVLMMVLVFLFMIPFMYLMYRWYVNFRWKDVAGVWRTSFWPSCFFILGQGLLTVITLGIYGPAGVLRAYRYFTARTAFTRDGAEVGRLGFDGDIGKGFGLLWGQSLLSLITVGIYLPWAYANVGRWLASATYFEKTGATGIELPA